MGAGLRRGASGPGPRPWARTAAVAVGAVTLAALVLSSTTAPQPADMTRTASSGPAPTPSVSHWAVAPGGQVTVGGRGFRPGSRVDVAIMAAAGSPGAELAAGPTGAVTALLAVPPGCRPGWRAVVLSGTAASGRGLTEEVAVDVTR